MAASVHGRPTIYCNDQCLWGVMQDIAYEAFAGTANETGEQT